MSNPEEKNTKTPTKTVSKTKKTPVKKNPIFNTPAPTEGDVNASASVEASPTADARSIKDSPTAAEKPAAKKSEASEAKPRPANNNDAIRLLAKQGITPVKNGHNWRRNLRIRDVQIREGLPSITLSFCIEGEKKPPTINPHVESEAQKVIDWFDAIKSPKELEEESVSLMSGYLAQAEKLYPTEGADLIKYFQSYYKEIQIGVDWKQHEFELQSTYEQWLAQIKVNLQARTLEKELSLDAYPSLYPKARNLKRKVHLYIGPTNSGKTYAAMEKLAQGETGAYLAPLRLLALEGQEALLDRQVPCSLITGEERKLVEGSKFTASTIEMANFSQVIDCAVIDEGQMLADKDRGWAWTAAICALPARELVIVAAPEAKTMLERYLTRLGESWEVHEFKRKNVLEVTKDPVRIHQVGRGDALIAFSRKDVLMWRQKLMSMNSNLSVAVIYGALSPEVRRAEAERFAKGEADVLVATDAIGMGLNLPIKRVVFSKVEKYDGYDTRTLETQELRQIAGRAGRFGMAEKGEVSTLNHEDQRILRNAIEGPSKEISCLLSIVPSDSQVLQMKEAMQTYLLKPILTFFKDHLVTTDPLFKASPMEDMIMLAGLADRRESLSMEEKFIYARTPIDRRDDEHLKMWEFWMKKHERGDAIKVGTYTMQYSGSMEDKLWEYERSMKILGAYCWLSWRFEEFFVDRESAEEQRQDISKRIEEILAKKASQKVQNDKKPTTHKENKPYKHNKRKW